MNAEISRKIIFLNFNFNFNLIKILNRPTVKFKVELLGLRMGVRLNLKKKR